MRVGLSALLWCSQKILVLNGGIYLGSDLVCGEGADAFFGSDGLESSLATK